MLCLCLAAVTNALNFGKLPSMSAANLEPRVNQGDTLDTTYFYSAPLNWAEDNTFGFSMHFNYYNIYADWDYAL